MFRTYTEFINYVTYHIANSKYKFDPQAFQAKRDKANVVESAFDQIDLTCLSYILLFPSGQFNICLADGCEYFGYDYQE